MSDLISRSKLQQAIKRSPAIMDKGKHYVRLDAVLGKLLVAPTIDAVPVVHGKWVLGVPITCSVCGKPAAEHDSPIVFWESPYCPWCGAKMDAKGDEESE